MTPAQIARISMVEDQLEVLGWTLREPEAPGDPWTAECGLVTVRAATPEHVLQLVQRDYEPARRDPVRKSRPPAPRRRGKRGRRPRKDALENLLRCPLDERPGLPCLALLWNRTEDLRRHLAAHIGASAVSALTPAQVARHYQKPTDVADDGTGDLPEGQTDPSGEPREGASENEEE